MPTPVETVADALAQAWRDKRPADSIASNMGHCLWTGIIDADHAAPVARWLTGSDMASGWGLRTLAQSMARYDPLSYHNGSVWPHDNALVVSGLGLYGMARDALPVRAARSRRRAVSPASRGRRRMTSEPIGPIPRRGSKKFATCAAPARLRTPIASGICSTRRSPISRLPTTTSRARSPEQPPRRVWFNPRP